MSVLPVLAPDYVQPVVAWRCWAAAWVEGELRLCSPVYETVWPVRSKVHAECRASTKRWLSRQPPPAHTAPSEGCRCGIYGVDDPSRAVSFVRGQGFVAVPGDVVETVLGKVLLWGSVVECDHGWRAECAYPAALYLSARGPYRTFGLRPPEGHDRRAALEGIAGHLRSYGVPVHLFADDSLAAVAAALTP
jgi:hypothetical protein